MDAPSKYQHGSGTAARNSYSHKRRDGVRTMGPRSSSHRLISGAREASQLPVSQRRMQQHSREAATRPALVCPVLAGGAAATAGRVASLQPWDSEACQQRSQDAAEQALPTSDASPTVPRSHRPRRTDMRQVIVRRDQAGRAVRQNHVEDRQVLADQQAGAAQRHLRRRQLQVVREVCRDFNAPRRSIRLPAERHSLAVACLEPAA